MNPLTYSEHKLMIGLLFRMQQRTDHLGIATLSYYLEKAREELYNLNNYQVRP